MRYTEMNITTNQLCQDAFGPVGDPEEIIDSQICTHDNLGNGNFERDTCNVGLPSADALLLNYYTV